ncbi:MAG: hypothetical protein RDU20_11975 [Desulfomonilaceae bacterium]|nr:hypothetical protein [Desulfomonilaceae bacterium]
MRVLASVAAILLTIAVLPACVQAQGFLPQSVFLQAQRFFPQGMELDGSFRMELLFGSQMLRALHGANRTPELEDVFKVLYNPRLPVLAGDVEISPFYAFSGRIGGALSIFERDLSSTRGFEVGGVETPRWVTRPDYQSWEAAGLYHLHKGGGYRFSVVAGYRQSVWRYHGELEQGGDSRLRDTFASNIPFIGMQTAMFSPWWKARFEVIGSPFMKQNSTLSIRQAAAFSEHNVETDKGGLIEFRLEGTVALQANLRLGVFACYYYQELTGRSTGSGAGPFAENLSGYYTRESMASVGLNLNVVY